jgi:hypothetical protein
MNKETKIYASRNKIEHHKEQKIEKNFLKKAEQNFLNKNK